MPSLIIIVYFRAFCLCVHCYCVTRTIITFQGMAEHRFSIVFNYQCLTLLLYLYKWIPLPVGLGQSYNLSLNCSNFNLCREMKDIYCVIMTHLLVVSVGFIIAVVNYYFSAIKAQDFYNFLTMLNTNPNIFLLQDYNGLTCFHNNL